MKRMQFLGWNFGIYFVANLIDVGVLSNSTGQYASQGHAFVAVLLWLLVIVVLWNVYRFRAFDMGLRSDLHGGWCLVPFACLYFLIAPTGSHGGHTGGNRQ